MTSAEVEEIKGHFDKVSQGVRGEIAGLRGDVAELRAEGVAGRGETAELRQEVGGLRQDVGGLRGGVVGLREDVAEVRRHVGVVAEDLRSEIRTVAEGVALANERIDHLDLRVDGLTTEMRRGFAAVRVEIHRLHETDDELRRRIEAQERRGA